MDLYYDLPSVPGLLDAAIIYMWPRYVHNREKYPKMSRWEAFFSEDNRVDLKSDVQHGDEVESDKDGNEKNQYE